MVEANIEAGNSSGDGPLVTAARGVEKGVERTVTAAKEQIGKAKEGVGHAKERVSEQADSVTDYAKEHPGQTILVSLGVGALIGMLLSRR